MQLNCWKLTISKKRRLKASNKVINACKVVRFLPSSVITQKSSDEDVNICVKKNCTYFCHKYQFDGDNQ